MAKIVGYKTPFKGKLDGKTVYDFREKLDYGVGTLKKRRKVVDETMFDENGRLDSFFEEYFNNRDNLVVKHNVKLLVEELEEVKFQYEVAKNAYKTNPSESIVNTIKFYESEIERIKKQIEEELNSELNVNKPYFNVHPKSYSEMSEGGDLSHDNNVCREIENIGSYLMNYTEKNSKDLHLDSINADSNQPRNDFDTQNSRDFRRKELTVNIDGNMVEINDKNYKHTINQRIYSDDLKEISEIKDLQDFINYCNKINTLNRGLLKRENDKLEQTIKKLDKANTKGISEEARQAINKEKSDIIKKIKQNEKQIKIDNKILKDYFDSKKDLNMSNYKLMRALNKHSTLCKDDQILIKDSIKGTIYFKSPLPDSTELHEDMIDWTDIKHIRELLRFKRNGYDKWNSYSIHTVNDLLEQIELSKEDMDLIWIIQNRHDLKDSEIIEELNISKNTFNSRLDSIANRVIKKNSDNWLDWVYMNYVKGNYKQCKVCGEFKIEQFFSKNQNTKDICKDCL